MCSYREKRYIWEVNGVKLDQEHGLYLSGSSNSNLPENRDQSKRTLPNFPFSARSYMRGLMKSFENQGKAGQSEALYCSNRMLRLPIVFCTKHPVLFKSNLAAAYCVLDERVLSHYRSLSNVESELLTTFCRFSIHTIFADSRCLCQH